MTDRRNRYAYIEYDGPSRQGDVRTKRIDRTARYESPVTVGIVIDYDNVLELSMDRNGDWELVQRKHGTRANEQIALGHVKLPEEVEAPGPVVESGRPYTHVNRFDGELVSVTGHLNGITIYDSDVEADQELLDDVFAELFYPIEQEAP